MKSKPHTYAGHGSSAEMTYSEIAAILGCSKSRVEQIEKSALRKLRAALEQEAKRDEA